MQIEQIATELCQQAGTWLDTPDEASEGLADLRGKLQTLGGIIGKKAASDALRALQSSEKDIRRSRQREAAEVLAAALRPLGIVLVAQAPPKRLRVKAAADAPRTLSSSKPSASPPVGETQGHDAERGVTPGGGFGRTGS